MYMFPDHVALLSVTRMAKGFASSALPNAPVIDDSFDRPSVGQRLTAFRKRVAEVVWPGELVVPEYGRNIEPQPATIPGC
jgi:hypothetical protein